MRRDLASGIVNAALVASLIPPFGCTPAGLHDPSEISGTSGSRWLDDSRHKVGIDQRKRAVCGVGSAGGQSKQQGSHDQEGRCPPR